MSSRFGTARFVQCACAWAACKVPLLLSLLGGLTLGEEFVALDDGPGCETGASVQSWEICQNAATSLGYPEAVVPGSWSHAPTGCFVGHAFDGWGSTFFNTIPADQQTNGNSDYRSICRQATESSNSVTDTPMSHPEVAHPVAEEFYRFLAGSTEVTGEKLTVCFFGLGDYTASLSRRLLQDTSSLVANVRFLRAGRDVHTLAAALTADFPDRVYAEEGASSDDALVCSVVMLAVEDPRFHAEQIRAVAEGVSSVIVAYLSTHCTYERSHQCRFFHNAWEGIMETVGVMPSCTQAFCAATLPTVALVDESLAAMDCRVVTGPDAPASPSSQWQQDWFVYHNFFKGTPLDIGGGYQRRGVFVDIGAFHPILLSNTLLFERCLGWHGLVVEPNPGFHDYFRAYRTAATLVPHCVWSRPRKVTMSFHKDPIEAYIQEDITGDTQPSDTGASGAVLIQGDPGDKPKFEATCLTLDDILTSNGLRKPATIDYMSVDAEAAELEIFRDFPFEEFDLRVVSIEVQVHNYYELDTIFFTAGYAKVGVLGGDHVYAKLGNPTTPPAGMKEWHTTLGKDFHSHAQPRTAIMK